MIIIKLAAFGCGRAAAFGPDRIFLPSPRRKIASTILLFLQVSDGSREGWAPGRSNTRVLHGDVRITRKSGHRR